jgi:hypothetical protein
VFVVTNASLVAVERLLTAVFVVTNAPLVAVDKLEIWEVNPGLMLVLREVSAAEVSVASAALAEEAVAPTAAISRAFAFNCCWVVFFLRLLFFPLLEEEPFLLFFFFMLAWVVFGRCLGRINLNGDSAGALGGQARSGAEIRRGVAR